MLRWRWRPVGRIGEFSVRSLCDARLATDPFRFRLDCNSFLVVPHQSFREFALEIARPAAGIFLAACETACLGELRATSAFFL